MKILITGSSGLIGTTLCKILENEVDQLYKIDIRSTIESEKFSFYDPVLNNHILKKVDGVIHLAGYSRIPAAVKHPDICWQTNAIGTHSLVKMIMALQNPPWFIYASSREVYGNQKDLPVTEESSYQPLNIYAKSKIYAENIINKSVTSGLRAEIIRFSNVYGSICDYEDRVIPAFTYAALNHLPLNVIGKNCIFDFTFVDDVAYGICKLACRLNANEPLIGPLHFASGIGTTLSKLAYEIIELTHSRSPIIFKPARNYGASCFIGNSMKSRSLLNWYATTNLRCGIHKFLEQINSEINKTVEIKTIAV